MKEDTTQAVAVASNQERLMQQQLVKGKTDASQPEENQSCNKRKKKKKNPKKQTKTNPSKTSRWIYTPDGASFKSTSFCCPSKRFWTQMTSKIYVYVLQIFTYKRQTTEAHYDMTQNLHLHTAQKK